jgi:hypothetical protein
MVDVRSQPDAVSESRPAIHHYDCAQSLSEQFAAHHMSGSIHQHGLLQMVFVLWILVSKHFDPELKDRLVPWLGHQLGNHDARKAETEDGVRLDMSLVWMATWHRTCYEDAVFDLCHRALIDFGKR